MSVDLDYTLVKHCVATALCVYLGPVFALINGRADGSKTLDRHRWEIA